MTEAYDFDKIDAFNQPIAYTGINAFKKKTIFLSRTNEIVPKIQKLSINNLTNKTCDLVINLTAVGTIHWTILESSKPVPTKAKIINKAAGAKQGTENYYIPNITKIYKINSLTKNTLYTLYVVIKDINGNTSGIIKQEFKTKNMDIKKVNIHTKSHTDKLNAKDRIEITFNETVDLYNRNNIKYLMKQWRNLIGIGNTKDIAWFKDNKTLSIVLGEKCKLKSNSTLLILVCISEKSVVYDGKFAKIPALGTFKK